jgi:hypothetical protein
MTQPDPPDERPEWPRIPLDRPPLGVISVGNELWSVPTGYESSRKVTNALAALDAGDLRAVVTAMIIRYKEAELGDIHGALAGWVRG